jgi:hypothetical protein
MSAVENGASDDWRAPVQVVAAMAPMRCWRAPITGRGTPQGRIIWGAPLSSDIPGSLPRDCQEGTRRPRGYRARLPGTFATRTAPAGKEGARLKEAPGRKYSQHREACSPWGERGNHGPVRGRMQPGVGSPMPKKPRAPSEPADYRRWKTHAAALLRRQGI